jgi:hypothetical protein
MKARVRIRIDTGELDGVTVVGYDPDVKHVRPDNDGSVTVIAVALDHPALGDQLGWRGEWNGKRWILVPRQT